MAKKKAIKTETPQEPVETPVKAEAPKSGAKVVFIDEEPIRKNARGIK